MPPKKDLPRHKRWVRRISPLALRGGGARGHTAARRAWSGPWAVGAQLPGPRGPPRAAWHRPHLSCRRNPSLKKKEKRNRVVNFPLFFPPQIIYDDRQHLLWFFFFVFLTVGETLSVLGPPLCMYVENETNERTQLSSSLSLSFPPPYTGPLSYWDEERRGRRGRIEKGRKTKNSP